MISGQTSWFTTTTKRWSANIREHSRFSAKQTTAGFKSLIADHWGCWRFQHSRLFVVRPSTNGSNWLMPPMKSFTGWSGCMYVYIYMIIYVSNQTLICRSHRLQALHLDTCGFYMILSHPFCRFVSSPKLWRCRDRDDMGWPSQDPRPMDQKVKAHGFLPMVSVSCIYFFFR